MPEIKFTVLNSGKVEAYLPEKMRSQVKQDAFNRQRNAILAGRKQTRGIAGTGYDSLEQEALSLAAEYVVARYFGQDDWKPEVGKPDKNTGDIIVNGHGVEVKSVASSNRCLVVDRGAEAFPHVLVVMHDLSHGTIVGWMNGDDAKREEWWREDRRHPNFFVPQEELYPIAHLESLLLLKDFAKLAAV